MSLWYAFRASNLLESPSLRLAPLCALTDADLEELQSSTAHELVRRGRAPHVLHDRSAELTPMCTPTTSRHPSPCVSPTKSLLPVRLANVLHPLNVESQNAAGAAGVIQRCFRQRSVRKNRQAQGADISFDDDQLIMNDEIHQVAPLPGAVCVDAYCEFTPPRTPTASDTSGSPQDKSTPDSCDVLSAADEERLQRSYNAQISRCAKKGEVERGKQILSVLVRRGVTPNVIIYTSLISLFSKGGQVEEASQMLQRMSSDGVMPNVRTFNCLINACVKDGRVLNGERFLNDMISRHISPDRVTFTMLINCCVKDGRVGDATRFLRAMETQGLKLDPRPYVALMNVCARAEHIQAVDNALETACSLLDEMETKGLIDDDMQGDTGGYFAYNSVISVCTHCPAERALEKDIKEKALSCLHRMKVRGIQPNSYTFCPLIKVMGMAGDVQTAVALYESIPYRPDEWVLLALVDVCCKWNLSHLADPYVRQQGYTWETLPQLRDKCSKDPSWKRAQYMNPSRFQSSGSSGRQIGRGGHSADGSACNSPVNFAGSCGRQSRSTGSSTASGTHSPTSSIWSESPPGENHSSGTAQWSPQKGVDKLDGRGSPPAFQGSSNIAGRFSSSRFQHF